MFQLIWLVYTRFVRLEEGHDQATVQMDMK
jgi:hypothetical protein